MDKVTLPPETWLQIIENIAYIPEYPSAYLDNDSPGDTLYSVPQEYASEVQGTFKDICNIRLVDRLLHDLSVPFFFETTQITKEETLWKFVKLLQINLQFKENFSSYAKRFIFVINDDEESGRVGPVGEGTSQSLLTYRRPTSPSRFSTEDVDRIRAAATEIVSCCRQLSHFSCTLPWCTKSTRSPERVNSSNEAEEYSTSSISSQLPLLNLQSLRTLRIGRIGDLLRFWIINIDEFTNLHTLQGPWDIIFLLFRKIRLPSLCNVVLMKNDGVGISSEEFFRMHGYNIKSLVSLHNFGEDFLKYCPNLQDLVVDILDVISFIGENSQVKRLGICTSSCPPRSFWEHFFRFLAGMYGPYMTNLEVVRLVNRGTCRDLRQNNALGLRLWDRRFRDRNVRLEDEQGDLMVNNPAESVSGVVGQLNINDL